MSDILEVKGYLTITAKDGYEAIDIVKKQKIDITLLDIMMPRINGFETYKEIKKLSPLTMVILMAAYAVEDIINEALDEGVFSCMMKPLEMDALFSYIERASKVHNI